MYMNEKEIQYRLVEAYKRLFADIHEGKVGRIRKEMCALQAQLSQDDGFRADFISRFENEYAHQLSALFEEFLSREARMALRKRHPGVLDTTVDRLGLPAVVSFRLRRYCGPTVEHVLMVDEDCLMTIPGIGQKRRDEIVRKIDALLVKNGKK